MNTLQTQDTSYCGCHGALFPSIPGSSVRRMEQHFLHPLRLGVDMWLSLKWESLLLEAVRTSACFAMLCPSGTCLAFKKVAALSSGVPELLP